MAQYPARIARDARGFTLIELLVVVLVIGVLAAIAIPSFLGQGLKAKDAAAKSDVKRLSQMIEECKTEAFQRNYTQCNSDAELDGTPGLSWGSGPGQVGMLGGGPEVYVAYAVSTARTGNNNHVFFIIRDDDAVTYRVCTPGSAGACPEDNFW